MELTEEQKLRIEANKQRAKELLEKRKAEQEAIPKCINHQECKSTGIDQAIFEAFNEKICTVCKINNPDYDFISSAEARSSYLVSDDSLKILKHKTRDNPHNAGWTPMKLYLRKQVYELSMKRFDSEEKLELTKKEREMQKFEKSLEKTDDLLVATTKDLWQRLNEPSGTAIPSIENNINTTLEKRKRGSKASESHKKKRSALSGLIGIFKGSAEEGDEGDEKT